MQTRHITWLGIAASAMNSLARVWLQNRLSVLTKLRVYQTCIVPVLLYCSDTWTMTSAESKRLQAFHMRCQRRILGVRWENMVRNDTIAMTTGLPSITDTIESRRSALFGHVARLNEHAPARQALRLAMDACTGKPPSPSWGRPRGRPKDSWLTPLIKSGVPLLARWDDAIARGHGLLAQRPSLDTR